MARPEALASSPRLRVPPCRLQVFTQVLFGQTPRAANVASGVAPGETQVAQAERQLAFYTAALRCSATGCSALHGAASASTDRHGAQSRS